MMSHRSAKYVNKPPETHVKESNNKKHGKKHAEETSRSQWRGLVRLLALETSPMEAMEEDEEQEANTALMEGLEQAIHQKEAAIESYPAALRTRHHHSGEDAQAGAQVAHQIVRADAVSTAAAEVYKAENKRLSIPTALRGTDGHRGMENGPQAHGSQIRNANHRP
jgi:hypothetical protein